MSGAEVQGHDMAAPPRPPSPLYPTLSPHFPLKTADLGTFQVVQHISITFCCFEDFVKQFNNNDDSPASDGFE